MNDRRSADQGSRLRTLSSGQTFMMKWIFTPFWIIAFGIATIAIWNGEISAPPEADDPIPVRWMFLISWIVGATVSYLTVGRVKRVRADDKQLWISNYLREIVVPLSDVTEVRHYWWISPSQGVAHLRRDYGFGDKIHIMLRGRFYLPWRGHPDVMWLREAAQKAGGLR